MNTKLRIVKISSRIALGLVWFYEGLVPKILFLRADEIGLVQASHLIWRTPQLTLQILGVAQMLVGLWLIIGFAERTAVFIATSWMLILIVLVASGNPSMLIDPYGALVKDFCLIACAITVWTLAPMIPQGAAVSKPPGRFDNRCAWADAIAADMATVFESASEDYFDQQLGIRLRNAIYAMGACAI